MWLRSLCFTLLILSDWKSLFGQWVCHSRTNRMKTKCSEGCQHTNTHTHTNSGMSSSLQDWFLRLLCSCYREKFNFTVLHSKLNDYLFVSRQSKLNLHRGKEVRWWMCFNVEVREESMRGLYDPGRSIKQTPQSITAVRMPLQQRARFEGFMSSGLRGSSLMRKTHHKIINSYLRCLFLIACTFSPLYWPVILITLL